MSISDYMAGTVLAMTGKDSVCIATDLLMSEGMVEVAQNMKKVGGIGCWSIRKSYTGALSRFIS